MTRTVNSAGVLVPTAVACLLCAGCAAPHFLSSNAPSNPAGNNSKVATGPVLDAWWEAGSNGLRVVYGVPGAAHQGSVDYNDGTYSGASVCMRGGIALLTTEAGAVAQVQLPQGSPVAIAIPSIRKPLITFSPTCSSALVYSSSSRAAEVVQGLLSTPKVGGLNIPDRSSVLGVSDTGSVLLGVNQPEGGVEIELLTASSMPKPVVTLSKLGGAIFIPGSDSVLLADSGTSTVMEASQGNQNLSISRIAGPRDGVDNPVAVGASADGGTAVIANASGSTILRIDLSGRTPAAQTACRCTPSELVPQSGNLSFRVNEPGSGITWAFDGDASVPRMVFVPSEQIAIKTHGAH